MDVVRYSQLLKMNVILPQTVNNISFLIVW